MKADDFTVIVEQAAYVDSVSVLPGIYWAWAENILETEPFEYRDPSSHTVDVN